MSDQFDLGILVLRVIVGFTMAAHGYNKFFGGGRIGGTGRWFDSIGMRPGRLHAKLAASTEIVSGLLLAAGFLTMIAGAAFVAVMFVAAYTVHKGSGFFVNANGWEYNLVLATVGVAVATTGAGSWSVDAAIGIAEALDGWTGLTAALVGGLIAAAVQLAVFFRPPAKSDSRVEN
ncbi:DoxX family protein [Rhodococcoides yunnanense]|uniref:DoxX family protein n=1 Tax=Rhodococcoides yunnanense TaxID=278209 RepID=A0ABU4BKE9_9NOCA|nr:DoxX family protein [Rhodococcus yunnanensis]MDV6264648.1 DoxX family protein [Rhodococcus yunnanensis]